MGGGGGRKSKPKKLKNKRKRAGCVTDAGAACQSSHLHFTHRLAQYRKQTEHKQRKYQGRQQELKKAAESRRTNAILNRGFRGKCAVAILITTFIETQKIKQRQRGCKTAAHFALMSHIE